MPETNEPTKDDMPESGTSDRRTQYWQANIRIVSILLFIWFVVAYGCSILFIDQLNQIQVGSVGLGFWFAQQGSILVFIVLVAVYAFWMDRLDRKYDVGE